MKKANGAAYQAKCTAERKSFEDVMRRGYQKCDVFKIARMMVKTNQDIVDEWDIWNGDGMSALINACKKTHRKRIFRSYWVWNS